MTGKSWEGPGLTKVSWHSATTEHAQLSLAPAFSSLLSMQAEYPIQTPAQVIRWLVKDGTPVVEGKAIAELSGGRELLAPISGRLSLRAPSAPSASSSSSSSSSSSETTVGVIVYCLHLRLVGQESPMCTVCGLEISSLPPRTLAVYMEAHGGRKGGGARAGGGGGGGGSAAQLPSHMRSFSMKGGLVVSVTERAALESDAALLSRLRASRKLSLLLDLDQTLIHATMHARGVEAERGGGGFPPCAPGDLFRVLDGSRTYWIKVRPGAREFLEAASKLYELHVDTAGLSTYADSVLQGLDPEGKYFGGRVTARDHGLQRPGELLGSRKFVHWAGGHRTLMDDSMSVIVDDNTRVWGGSGCLLHIEKYLFWRLGGRAVNNSNEAGPADTPKEYPPAKEREKRGGSAAAAAAAGEQEQDAIPYLEEPHAYLGDVLRVLQGVHAEWFLEHDRALAEGTLQQAPPRTSAIISRILSRVLSGVSVCFSGVFTDAWDRDAIAATPLVKNLVAFGGCLVDAVNSTRIISPLISMHLETTAAGSSSASSSLPPHVVLQSVGAELGKLSRPVLTHLVTTERSLGDTGQQQQEQQKLQQGAAAAAAALPQRFSKSSKVAKAIADHQVRVVPLQWLQECIRRYARVAEGAMLQELGQEAAASFPQELATRPQDARVHDLLALLGVLAREAVARKAEQGQRAAAQAREEEQEQEGEEEEEEEEDGGEGVGGGKGAVSVHNREALEEEEEMMEHVAMERSQGAGLPAGRKRQREEDLGGWDSDDSEDSLARALNADD